MYHPLARGPLRYRTRSKNPLSGKAENHLFSFAELSNCPIYDLDVPSSHWQIPGSRGNLTAIGTALNASPNDLLLL
ncbi:uncharacterized protein PHALS_06807 [Plasmopara halstedii]|uniref:Uncharacterized protein n=1 Tax=Plasmopara halstedii TaxID=4781 RepID=A0A0P1B2S2_PLAHL|nr:uncharacterized protein PHALS_06807 [Plasmopara halstedii]CEG49017.1 hypothetical protein PHALS_06807 [Plasmopara halstedii]|eukprot:XP_024585386.1 hypothetical protein PHALS_06807 [Plasmopara halstedii]